jgi:hypothetical protein
MKIDKDQKNAFQTTISTTVLFGEIYQLPGMVLDPETVAQVKNVPSP